MAVVVTMGARALDRVLNALTVERRLFGCALLRVGLAVIVLYYLLGHWAQRLLLWGPRGLYPLWLFERRPGHMPSLFAVGSEPLFDALYIAAIAVAFLYAIGWKARWIGLPFYLLACSLLTRNPFMLTGGDNLVLVTLPFVVLLNTSAYLSADSGWRGARAIAPPARRPWAGLVHNFALAAILIQLCIMYFASGLAKVAGHAWQHGTALYYIVRMQEFGQPSLSPFLYGQPWLIALATYLVIAYEVAFPFLIWGRRTRWLVVGGAAALHGSIAVVMGLVPFAAEALVFQFVVVADDQYVALVRALERARRRMRRRRVDSRPALESLRYSSGANGRPVPQARLGGLASSLARIERASGGTLGVAVLHVQSGDRISYRGEEWFPMVSVRKVPLAIELLACVDCGRERLDRSIAVEPGDLRRPGLLADSLYHPGIEMPLSELLELMLRHSDNTATATLARVAGGFGAIARRLDALSIAGVDVAQPIELPPVPPRLARQFRRADSRGVARPEAVAEMLARLWRGELLSASSTELLLGILRRCQTGDLRIRARVPPGAIVANKTGTAFGCTNDVGVVELPDGGGCLAVAVFDKWSPELLATRERAVAEAAGSVIDLFSARLPETNG